MPRITKLKDIPKRLLKVTKENSIQPKTGDIFVFSIHQGEYMFGKVISTDVNCGFGYPDPLKTLLIYMYNYKIKDKKNIPVLYKEDLLGRPLFVNKEIWMWGYFEVVDNKPICKEEVYSPLCFEYLDGKYYDEKGKILGKKYPGCSSDGSTNIFGVESMLLKNLGEDLVYYN